MRLQAYFNNRNINIHGYDKTRSPLCLISENIRINYTDDINVIPSEIKEKKQETFSCVYSNT